MEALGRKFIAEEEDRYARKKAEQDELKRNILGQTAPTEISRTQVIMRE